MKIPTRKECMKILEGEGVPDNIIRHPVKTAKVAKYLAIKMNEAGGNVNVDLVDCASLLHDISKFKSMKKTTHHTEDGWKVLRKMGFDDIAEIVEKHGIDSIFKGRLKVWEEKIVYYADKRVNEDKIVSLEERMDFLKMRYPYAKEKIVRVFPLIKKLEEEIFRKIGESPDLEVLKK